MSKLVQFFKVERGDFTKPSVMVLILANLVPLFGVLFLDWKVFPILMIFWIENVIIGVFNVLKMVFSAAPVDGKGFSKIVFVPFFCVHYGTFTLVHGIFIVALFGGVIEGGIADSLGFSLDSFLNAQTGWAVLALLISHLFSFVTNYLGKQEYKTTTLSQLMSQPYGRVVIMHLTILAGGFLLMFSGSPLAGLVVLVLFKIGIDIPTHLRQHKLAAEMSVQLV